MAYMPSPPQTLLSFDGVPSWSDVGDFFLFSDINNGISITEAELLPAMEESEEELWLETLWNHSVPLSQEESDLPSTCSDCDMSTISSGDLSAGSGIVQSESDFSSFPAPFSSTISFNSQFKPDSSFSSLPATTSTNIHATLKKPARKHSQNQQQQQEVVTFLVEGNGDTIYDGYGWRKYGEKSIKHRAYPRSYYRCGHDGCKVKKRVEQSTENPLEFHITYYGRHNHSAITDFSSIGYN